MHVVYSLLPHCLLLPSLSFKSQDPSVWLLLHSAPAKMSSVSLSQWLQSLSLSEYEEAFQQQGFTALHQVSGITQERLKEIGVVKLGHVKRILKNIPQIMNGEEATQPSTASGKLVPSGKEQPQPIQAHVGGEEEGEAPPPALPPRRRRSSSGLSDSDSHSETFAVGSPERNLSPPPMDPLHEGSTAKRPQATPRRQHSLHGMQRGSCEGEDVHATCQHSSRERQSQRMSLPPDSITCIPGLTDTRSPPPVPLRKSSLTPSPDPTMTPPSRPMPEQSQASELPTGSPDSPLESEPSVHNDEINNSAAEVYVDQRLLAGGPPSFSPVPPPVPEGEEENEAEEKLSTASCPSYVNVDRLFQAPSLPTPLPRKSVSQKHPVAVPRRKKPAAPSAQPSDFKPADPTSGVHEDEAHEPTPAQLTLPQHNVVKRQQMQRADAMQDEYVYTDNPAQPVLDPRQQQSGGVSLDEYEDMDSPGPAYEPVDVPAQLEAVPPPSLASPPLPAGITSGYSVVELPGDDSHDDMPTSRGTTPEILPVTPPTSGRQLVCLQTCCSFTIPSYSTPPPLLWGVGVSAYVLLCLLVQLSFNNCVCYISLSDDTVGAYVVVARQQWQLVM